MYTRSLEPQKGPGCGADFSLLCAISAIHPQSTTLRDLGINSSSSAALTSTLLRHFSSMQKPRDAMTAVFDDHGTSDDMDTELYLDYPVLPPQQSLDDHNFVPLITVQHQILQRNKGIYAVIEQFQRQAA
jgi:hypothetical protein